MHKTVRFNDLSVALVYDHLTTSFGGAELVLQTLHEIFPKAPIFTSVYELPKNSWAQSLDIRTSFLQHIPFIKKYHQLLAPLHPLAFENHNIHSYDIVISISNGPAKGVLTLPHQLHICYLLTPTRYLSIENKDTQTYLQSQPLFSFPGVSLLARPFFKYLQRWDAVAAWRPDFVIAISKVIAERSQRHYHRKADAVIYPPFKKMDVTEDTLPIKDFLLCLTRLTSYKRVDLAISAALQSNKTLVIAGDGVQKKALLELAGANGYLRTPNQSLPEALTSAQQTNKNIIFINNCTEEEKAHILSQCKALLMPGEEDFGLVGLEAASLGKPVITYYNSGIAEVIKDGKTGIHLKTQTVAELTKALKELGTHTFNKVTLKKTVEEYEVDWFKELFHKTIYHFWQQHSTISPVGAN